MPGQPQGHAFERQSQQEEEILQEGRVADQGPAGTPSGIGNIHGDREHTAIPTGNVSSRKQDAHGAREDEEGLQAGEQPRGANIQIQGPKQSKGGSGSR
jgi:hypothetical protein